MIAKSFICFYTVLNFYDGRYRLFYIGGIRWKYESLHKSEYCNKFTLEKKNQIRLKIVNKKRKSSTN